MYYISQQDGVVRSILRMRGEYIVHVRGNRFNVMKGLDYLFKDMPLKERSEIIIMESNLSLETKHIIMSMLENLRNGIYNYEREQ